jgi:hypothetical protein
MGGQAGLAAPVVVAEGSVIAVREWITIVRVAVAIVGQNARWHYRGSRRFKRGEIQGEILQKVERHVAG